MAVLNRYSRLGRPFLRAAYDIHPERFVRKSAYTLAVTCAAWINPPQEMGAKSHEVQH